MNTRRTVKTFEAKIYVGLRCRYSREILPMKCVQDLCMEAVKDGWCLTVQPIEFIYTPTFTVGQLDPVDGEPGAVIGAINYPRFPTEPNLLKEKMIALADALRKKLDQERVSVVFTDETVLVEGEVVSTEKSLEK